MSNPAEVRHVLVIEDQKSRRLVSLTENTYDIGRDPHSAIPLYDRQVSRHHATLLRVNDYQNEHCSYRLIDGNLQGKRSTNGVMINGQYCLSHELRHGDLIRFASKSKASYHIISVTTESDLEALQNESLGVFHAVKPKSTSPGVTIAEEALALAAESFDPEESDEGEDSAFSTAIFYTGAEGASPSPTKRSLPSADTSNAWADHSPYPVLEFTLGGEIVYLNPPATAQFPDLPLVKQEHPLIKGVLSLFNDNQGTSLAREVEIGPKIYEQSIYWVQVEGTDGARGQRLRSYVMDITAQRRLDQEVKRLRQLRQLYRQLTSEGLLFVDADTKKIVEVNPAYCQLLGYSEAELLAQTFYQVAAADRDTLDSQLMAVQQQEPVILEETFHRTALGELHPVAVKLYHTIWMGRATYCLTVQDLNPQQKLQEQVHFQELHDPVTHLGNRTYFVQQLEVALNHARHHDHQLGVLFVSLDSWRTINQSLGHAFGDQALQVFASRIQSCLREGDLVCHWQGEMLTVLLPRIKNAEAASKLADRIFEVLREPVKLESQELILLANMGIAIFPEDGDSGDRLLQGADVALGQLRQQGSYHHCFFNPQFSQEARLVQRLERLLAGAIARKQLSLVYQPQGDLETGKISGVEALLRWEHPEVGTIPPHKLIALAEKTTLIGDLSQLVMRQVCQQALAWQKEGLLTVPLAFNLSSQEFYQPQLTTRLAKIIEDVGVDPQWLAVEITEKTVQKSLSQSQKILGELKELGLRLVLDDFGRGYASLGTLQYLPLHAIKLDQKLIRDLRGTAAEQGFIEAILALGKGLHLQIIAEGVESDLQYQWLQDWGCQYIQGYKFSRPLKAKEMTVLLQQSLTIKLGNFHKI